MTLSVNDEHIGGGTGGENVELRSCGDVSWGAKNHETLDRTVCFCKQHYDALCLNIGNWPIGPFFCVQVGHFSIGMINPWMFHPAGRRPRVHVSIGTLFRPENVLLFENGLHPVSDALLITY